MSGVTDGRQQCGVDHGRTQAKQHRSYCEAEGRCRSRSDRNADRLYDHSRSDEPFAPE